MDPRSATAVWIGDGMTGKGTLDTNSGSVAAAAYSFKTRFQNEEGKSGTNPEELIAAALAGCFTMALSFALSKANHAPSKLTTTAEVSMKEAGGGFEVSGIKLILAAQVSGLEDAEFQAIAAAAKAGCPIAKALAAVPSITLEASLA
jgi:osmotically inducible protein OsmC